MIDDNDGGRWLTAKAERLVNGLLVLVVIACVAVVACHEHPGRWAVSGADVIAGVAALVQITGVMAMIREGNRSDYKAALGWACMVLIVDAVAELAAWWGAL